MKNYLKNGSHPKARLFASAAISTFALAGAMSPAFAQDAQVSTADSEDGDVIFVTGSRIDRAPGVDSPSPVVAITAENIEQSGLTNVTELLTQTPALFNSEDNFDAAGSQARTGAAGVNLLDLRNLGPNRTLVLVDGRRHVAGVSGEAAVDINSIPTSLIERVDILTGGVSSVYGADGVSGVVNFVMKKDFEGLDMRFQKGISDFGDADSTFASATFGQNFADGRGNFAVAYEFRKDGRVGFGDRPNGRYEADTLVRNPNDIPDDPNIPDNVFLNRIGWSESSPAGGIVTDFSFVPSFNGDGTPYDLGLFLPQSGFLAQGGDNTPINDYQGDLQARTKHHNVNAFLNFEVSPTINFFAEGKYVRTENFTIAQPSFDFFTYVGEENPFIPQAVRDAGGTDAFGGILFNRDNFDFGTRDEFFNRDLYRTVVGFDGDISDYARFEVSYVFGKNKTEYISTSQRIEDRYFAALDAVDEGEFLTGTPNGVVTCRVNVDGSGIVDDYNFNYGEAPQTFSPGECIPLNIFGVGSPSQEALDWILADTSNVYTISQHVVNGYVSGDFGKMFELPGGPIGFAFGGEYRKEKSDFRPDAISTQVADFDPNSGVLADLALLADETGSFDVWEVFGEIKIPILADKPFFDRLEVNVAGRYSDYSTIGSTEAWSVSGLWSPVPDISFRGSYSESVRAPNITELFAPRTGTFSRLTDPCSPANINAGTTFRAANCEALINGLGGDFDNYDFANSINSSATIEGIVSGNTALSEEKAESWTAGAVFQPSFVPGLAISVDWYDISLTNAVRTPTLTETAEFCVDSATLDNVFCDAVTRSPDPDPTEQTQASIGYVVGFVLGPQNVAFLDTAGADITVNYRFSPGNIGDISLRGTLGYLDKLEFLPANGGIVDDDRGEAGSPKWVGNADITWMKDNFTLNYGVQYIGSQLRFEIDEIAGDPDIAAPEFLSIGSRFMHDIRGEWTTDDERFSFFAGVNNFTNELPSRGLDNTPTGWLGRYFFAGVRVKLDVIPGF